MANDQIQEMVSLRESGYSLRQISEQVGLSKSSVDRMLKAYDETAGDEDELEAETAKGQRKTGRGTGLGHDSGTSSTTVEMKKVQLEHLLKMAETKVQLKQLELHERQQDLREKALEIEQEKSLDKAQQRFEKAAIKKSQLFRRYKRLVRELRDSCQDYVWDLAEVQAYLNKVETLMEQVEQFCNQQNQDYEELAMWDNLDTIEDSISQLLQSYDDRFFKNGNIDFDFSDEDLDQLEEALQLEDFDDLADFDEDGQEDDDDADADDDENEDEEDEDY